MKEPLEEVHIDELLQTALAEGWCELYLENGKPPYGRSHGSYQMNELSQYEVVRKNVLQRMCYDILTDEQIIQFEELGALHFSYSAQHLTLFSVRLIRWDTPLEASFRVLPRR